MAGVAIKVDHTSLRRWLRRVRQKGASQGDASIWEDVGWEVQRFVQQNFDNERGGGEPWRPLTPGYRAARPAGKILTVTGRLRNSIQQRAQGDGVLVGTNVQYAAIHQYGGKTRPTVIKPRRKQALFWPGAAHPVKSVNHPGSDVPARPFLDLSPAEWEQVARVLAEAIMR